MMELADMVLPPLALHSLNLSGVLLATIGAIFLAYELLGRENGPLRWFTLIMTCGILSALIFVPVVTLDLLLLKPGQVKLTTILALILAGGFMGFYSVNLVELPPSTTKLPIFSWRGSLLGLPLALLFWFGGFFLMGPQFGIPILTLGIACAIGTAVGGGG